MGDATSDLLGFLVMFGIIFFSHAIMGLVAFGAATDSFHTFGSSLETCSQMLLGDFDFDKAYEANPTVSVIAMLLTLYCVPIWMVFQWWFSMVMFY